MNWTTEVNPSPQATAKSKPATEVDARMAIVFETLKRQLKLLIEEARWWERKTGNKAELTRKVIAESIRYSKQELDTLNAIYNMPE